MHNYNFYKLGTYKEISQNIRQLISRWSRLKDFTEFYNQLESDHKYIQWLFPNQNQSQFNAESVPLNNQERDKMIQSKVITKRYLNHYHMILRFFGIISIQNELQIIDEVQFKKCCFQKMHNLLRLKRILTSLHCLNQKELANQLHQFLKTKFLNMDRRIYYEKYIQFYEDEHSNQNKKDNKDQKIKNKLNS